MKLLAIQVLTAALLVVPVTSRADLSVYSQDFENLVQASPTALGDNGWLVFANVFSADHSTYYYGYGPFPAPNNTGGFCGIDLVSGEPPQGAQDMVVYSDYNNGQHSLGFQIEANVFQQQIIGAADVGTTWTFRFDAKRGNLEAPTTALAFIKTLDPNNGYALTNFLQADMTPIPAAWNTYSISIAIAPGLVGQILQFGFLNTASNYKGSGVFYDNVSFAQPPVPMAFDFASGTLNLRSQGVWVTAYLEPPAPYGTGDIDVSSIRMNGTVPVDPLAPTAIGDFDGDGIADLMVKFDRLAVELTLTVGDQIPVQIGGAIADRTFAGTDHVRVRRAAVTAPAAGSRLAAGSVTQVRWETPGDVAAESVALYYSTDGGQQWSIAADQLPNSGSCDWTVPNVQTDQAMLTVVLIESADPTGTAVQGILGTSEPFAIDGIVGVGDGFTGLALRGVSPNPAREALRVSFSLSDRKAATLSLFDVTGRRLAERRVDGMGPGWHVLELGGSRLPAGLYVIRLTQGGRSFTTRAALVR
jgi:hypothetical protein